MKTLAAVLVETGRPLELVELQIPLLRPGQLLVKIAFTGVCHTQLLESRGYRGADAYLPHCLGHEASGMVMEVGPEVSRFSSGDRVVLSWIKGPGADVSGTVYDWTGRTVNAGAVTTFSQYAVVSENRVTRLLPEVDLLPAALLGCAVPTGAGSVFNVARVEPSQRVVIFGLGGIGLCAAAASVASDAAVVIGVDRLPTRLEAARQIGVTHTIHAGEEDPLARIRSLCPSGVDVAIEATGRPAVMSQALECVRNQGGTCVLIGNARYGERLDLDPKQFNLGKRLLGTWGGDNQVEIDFPKYQRLLAESKWNLAPLTANRYSLAEINQALDDLESGAAIRPIISC